MSESAPSARISTPVDATLVADQAPALLAFLDPGQRFQYVNLGYEQFYGIPRAEIVGRTLAEVSGAGYHAVAEPYVRRVLRGESISFASSVLRGDGAVRDLESSYSPHFDSNRQVTGFTSLIRDVTERTFMAEARARLAAIVDSSDDPIVSKNFDGIITSWNRAAERVFGYTASEAVGQHITLIVPPEKLAEENEVLARLRRGEKVDHFETVRRTKDGRRIHVALTVSPVRNARGEVIGASKIARDITQRTEAENALRASEEYRTAVLASMPECVKVLDRQGTVLHMNPAGLEMAEADSPEQIIGKSIYPLIDDEHREAFRAVNESVFYGGSGGRLEFVIKGLKGGRRIFETNVVPLRGGTKDIIGALSVTRDITSRKRREARDRFLVQLDDATRPLTDAGQITDTAARLLGEHLAVDRCAYAQVDFQRGSFTITGSYAAQSPEIVGEYALAAFGEHFGRRMTAGQVFVSDDIETALPDDGARRAYRQLGIGALIAVPLVKSGVPAGALAVHQATPRKWRNDEIELVQLVANRCWESIERSRIARELRESEQQFRMLANAIPNLAWMAHADGGIFWYNRRWYDYTGTTPDQMEGWGWQRVHDPSVLPAVLERWKHSITSGDPFEMVFPLRGADGQFRSFLTRVEPLRDESGRVIRWFGTNTDVTVQQEAENREKRARRTAELLNRIGPVLAAELNADILTQKITDIATEAIRAQFGAFVHTTQNETGEVVELYTFSGSGERFSERPLPGSTPMFPATLSSEGVVRSDDITADPRFAGNAPHPGSQGERLAVRSYLAAPVRSRTGAVLGGLVFGHSEPGVFNEEAEAIVTGIAAQAAIALDNASLFEQTRRSAQALRRSNRDLKRLNGDLNQFAYSASHDLREPLRMVSIYTQFLNRKLHGRLDAESERFVEHILKGASRLEALIRDLLAYTQAADSPEPHMERADSNEALNSALANLAAATEEAGAKVTSASLPAVKMVPVQLTQIFQNLIGNAIKYRSDAVPEIHIGATERGEEVEFFVSDNGIGIEPQYKEQIFGIFRRLHNPEEYSGTGIGLAICQRIVNRAGGRIWVESTPGRGSKFFFTLPAGV